MRIGMIVAIALLMLAATAGARTWRVELDGSGDFTDIQPAVDASAAGDTILIGPGRFDTFHPCVAPAWTEETVVWVTRDNLTFIGAGREETIIGPATYYGPYGFAPKGICSIDGYDGVIKDLTIENMRTGLYWWRGSFLMEDCRISGDDASFEPMVVWPLGATIRSCTINAHSSGLGCIIGMSSRDIAFENCEFLGGGTALTIRDSTQNVRIAGCRFVNSGNAIHCDQASSMAVVDCDFEWVQNGAIDVWNGSQALIERVQICHAAYGISAASGGTVTGSNIVVEGTWYAGVLACCNAFITIHNSHLLPAMGPAVKCEGQWAHSQLPDLTGCYWGTTDADAIRAAIWDANDTSETNAVVSFEPFANGPVPTERTSWGDLKASFR